MESFLNIKFKKPKSCSHCSAWLDGGSSYKNQHCLLGFRVEFLDNPVEWNLNYFESHFVYIKPKNSCLKPKTRHECSHIIRNMPSLDFFYNAT